MDALEASAVPTSPTTAVPNSSWSGRPFMGRLRVLVTKDTVYVTQQSEGKEQSSAIPPGSICLARAMPTVVARAQQQRSPLQGDSEYRVAALLGLIGLCKGTYLVAVSQSSCVLTLDGKRIYRVDSLTLVRVSLGESSVEALEEADNYCRFLAEQFRFYFSPDYDFTQSMQRWHPDCATDRRFFWNSFLAEAFLSTGNGRWILPVVDAFVAIQQQAYVDQQVCQYAIISRRGKRRAGTRYLCRGADLRGNVANFVETEQIVSRNGWLTSFLQIRGSIPVVWTQRGEGAELKPRPLVRYIPGWQWAHDRHLQDLQEHYGRVTAVSLVDFHGSEGLVGQAYELAAREFNFKHASNPYSFFWFDFHLETKGNRYEVVADLAGKVVDPALTDCFLRDERGVVLQNQSSVIRTNCIDCLDRTNVFQTAVAHRVLEKQLGFLGILGKGDKLERHVGFESAFKNLWADNADEMSRRYTGVGALKSDFTRTGQRTAKGLMQDGIKSVQRTVQHMTGDAQKQKLIDQFLGQTRAMLRGGVAAVTPPHVISFPAEGLIVELDQRSRLVLCYNPAQQIEWTITLDSIFCIGRVQGSLGGVRIWLKTQPDPVKILFKNATTRQDFAELCGALGALPTPRGDLSKVDILTITWNSPPLLQASDAAFSHLPKGAKVIVLALQNVSFAVPTTADPLISSAGMAADMYFVSLFRFFLEADYEMVQCFGGAATRTAVFVRLDMLPFIDNVYSCQVGSAALAVLSSSVDSLQPQKTFSSIMKEKLTAVKVAISQPSLQSADNIVGGAGILSILGTPLCFLNVGDVGTNKPASTDFSSGAGSGKSYLYFMGPSAAAFDPYNIYSSSPNTFWLGCATPSLFDVSQWLCLASNEAVRGHVLSLSPVLELMSSDPPGVSSTPQAAEKRAVACGFHIPLFLSTSGLRAQIVLTDVLVRVLNEPWPSLHLSLSSVCSVDGAVNAPPSSNGTWAGPLTINLILCCGGSEFVAVDVWTERTHLSRGRFLVADAFNKPEISFSTFDSHGVMWGTCKVRARGTVVPKGTPFQAPRTAQAQVLPPVPARPPRPAFVPSGDLLDFSNHQSNTTSPPSQSTGADLLDWEFMERK